MASDKRYPGSREEDAWLSDEQLDQVAPAEAEPFQGPVPTRMISNGEYMPHPQTEKQKHVEHRIKELAEMASKKLGISRRAFLGQSGGMAASLMAINEVFGKQFFKVSEEELFEPAAFAENAAPADLFVFDDQTHIVRSTSNNPQGLRALAQGPGSVSTAAGYFPGAVAGTTVRVYGNPNNGTGGNPLGFDEGGNPWRCWNPAQLGPDSPPNPGLPTTEQGEFHLGQYINRMYLQAQTSVSIISNANSALFTPPGGGVPAPATKISQSLQSEILTGWQTSQCRDFINALAGGTRALAHAQIYPGVGNLNDPDFGDYTQWQVENMQPDSWKGYNIAFAASSAPNSAFTRWRLDDEVIAYPTFAAITRNKHMLKDHPGFFNICIHKGLSAVDTGPGGANNIPQFGNPDDMVKAASDWPQLNFIIYHSCIRPSFWVLQSLADIDYSKVIQPSNAVPMQPTQLRDSDGHVVPNIRWSTQFAMIAGGRYRAGAEPTSLSPSSTRRLRNVYAELGTTMASMIVTFPTVWAHLIGQLLYYMGSENIVFGSDSMWYGGPQWQIDALWRFQIPEDIARRWGYPQITEKDKRNILGLNSARLYGLKANGKGCGKDDYPQGDLYNYGLYMKSGSYIDGVLRGPGYPVDANGNPVRVAANLLPNDKFTKLRKQYAEMGVLRDNTRFGFMRTRS